MAISVFLPLLGDESISWRIDAKYPQIPVRFYWEAVPPVSESDIWKQVWTVYWHEYTASGEVDTKSISSEYDTHRHTGEISIPASRMDVSKIAEGAEFRIDYYNDRNEIIGRDNLSFEIHGQIGENLYWDMALMGEPAEGGYHLTNETLSTVSARMTRFTDPASAVPYCNAGDNGAWGVTTIRRKESGVWKSYTLAEAKYAGFVPDTWTSQYSIVHVPDQIISSHLSAVIYPIGGFKSHGEYSIWITCFWHRPSQRDYPGVYIMSNTFTVYDPFKGAAFHIANITAAQYKQGDPDPLHGMPPYTVTLADDTVRQEYTIPLESIHIDWDDPYSDTPAWSISNPGTSAITIPPHVYTDTNTHVIRMTCVDKRGNTTTAEVSFAPSKQPRIILPPTLNGKAAGSTISMSYPALMAGTAYNAGSPAPQTEWSYVLQGSSAGYYSGSKIGDYAEFSLLAAGTYTVTAKITDDTIILGTYTWTVKVGAEPVSTAQDMPMQDFSLWVLDGETPVDACRQHTCPQYTRNYQGLDTVSFEIPEKYPYAKHLQEGDRFLFGFGGAARLMQVTYRRINAGIISIAGQTAFPDRVAVFATRSASDGGYDIQRCSAEAIIRYFIFTSAAPDPYTSTPRTVDIMMHGTNQDLPTGGDPVTYSARYDNILDIVTSICKTSGLGFSVAVRNTNRQNMTNSTQVHIIEGTNRTYSTGGASAVLFSDNLKNCRIESEQSAQTPTVAVVAGAGTGQYRQHTYYDADGNNNPSITGYQRRESFVDAGESADAAEQKRIAMLELREAKAVTVDIEVLPTAQYELGRDYDVGDIVSVWLDSRGGITDLQIYAADVVDRDTGREIHLHLGSRVLTAPALIAAGQRKNTYARK